MSTTNFNDKKAQNSFHYAYIIVAACIVILGVPCAMALSCAGIFYTPVANYFGVPKAQVSLYMSIMGFTMVVALPVVERLVKKIDFRFILSGGVVLVGIALLMMSQAPALWVFYIAGGILGFGITPLICLAVPTLINGWFAVRVGFFIGLCTAFTGVGGVIFNTLGTALINAASDGWRLAYLVFGVIILAVAFPFVFLFVRTKPVDKGLEPCGIEIAAKEEGKSTDIECGVSADKATKSSAFYAIVAFTFLVSMNLAVFQFFPSYCQSFGIEQLTLAAGVVASTCMAGQAIGKIVLGLLNDRSVKIGLLFAICVGMAGILLMWFGGPFLPTLLVGSFLFGAVYPCATVESPMLTRHAFGVRDYTTIFARISLGGAIASTIAPAFWGIIVDLPNGYIIMFMLSMMIMAAALALGLFAAAQRRKLIEMFE